MDTRTEWVHRRLDQGMDPREGYDLCRMVLTAADSWPADIHWNRQLEMMLFSMLGWIGEEHGRRKRPQTYGRASIHLLIRRQKSKDITKWESGQFIHY